MKKIFSKEQQAGFIMMLLVGFAFIFILPNVNADLGTFKQGDCVLIKTILNTSSVTISTIQYPNGSIATSSQAMSQTAQTFTYNFCDTNTTGLYTYDYYDAEMNTYVNTFSVTYSGNPQPDGFVIVLFVISFLLIVGYMSHLVISNVGHFAQLDYDLGDLIKNVSAYFVLVALYVLHGQYMGNELMDKILVWLMGIGGFTNVAVSFLAFIFSHLNRVATQEIKQQDL